MAKRKSVRDRGHDESELMPEIDLQEQYGRAEKFLINNSKLVSILTGLLLLCVVGYLYFSKVQIPQAEKVAQQEMHIAQDLFADDAFQDALDGKDGNLGFLEIIESHSGMTKSVNLAHYYAGICYLNLGDFESAVDYLGKYKAKDKVLGAMAVGAMGDAYSELGNMDIAIANYSKAIARSQDDFTAALWMQKLGMAYYKQGNAADAEKTFTDIKRKYPNSNQGRDADKYIQLVKG